MDQMKDQKSILLIEDDLVDAMTVKKVLKELNVERPLTVCKNGEEGLEFLENNLNNLPGIILLDLNMPKMNGLEFLKAIKSHPKFQVIPVVVLTTSDDHNDKLESYKLSIAGYMLKSFDYKKFIEVMRSVKHYWEVSELSY
ncbi:MAG: response regulator [Bacteroidota bacterium]